MMFQKIFLLALIALPFNDLPYFYSIFGELSGEGAFYFLLIIIFLGIIVFLSKEYLKIPRHKSFYILLALLVYFYISGLVNFPHIINAYFFGRTGTSKYVLQMVVFLFGISISIIVYNLSRRGLIDFIIFRRYVMISAIIVGAYGFIEILWNLNVPLASDFFYVLNPLIHTEKQGYFWAGQIRSVTGEPSWFGMYAAFIFPWLVSYLFTEKNYPIYIFIVAYFLLLIFLSQSRAAYGLIFGQIVILGFFYWKLQKRSVLRIVLYSCLVLIIFFMSSSLTAKFDVLSRMESGFVASLTDIEKDWSNITRFASQIAAFKIALDHPVFGIGLGQYGFYMHEYIPAWAMISGEIRELLRGAAWPPVHGLFARIAAEGGFPALALWLALWFSLSWSIWKILKNDSQIGHKVDWLAMALLTSMLGVFGCGLNIDSLRFPGYWISMGLTWAYLVNRTDSGDHELIPKG
jgi:O-antigen ligase